jgi:hypothetical protein
MKPFIRASSPALPARRRPGRTVRAVSTADLPRGGKEVRAQRLVGDGRAGALGVHDEIVMASYLGGELSENFPEETLDTVSNHCAAHFARDREPESMEPQLVRPPEKHEHAGIEPLPGIVQRPEVCALDNSVPPGKSLVRLANHSRSASSGPWPAAC